MSLPISGFTAVPNPQMLAFMATQSFLMMQMAGAGWQFGKRKISAMTNIEFNKLSTNQLLSNETADVRKAIPTIEASMKDMTQLMAPIVAQYGDFIKEAIKGAGQGITNLLGGQSDQIQVPIQTGTGTKFGVASFITPLLAEIKRLTQIQQSSTGQPILTPTDTAQVSPYIATVARPDLIPKAPALVPSNVRASHARWGHVSTQTLKIERSALITKLRFEAKHLKNEAPLIHYNKASFKFIKMGTRARRVRVTVPATRPNPVYIKRQQRVAKIQKKLIPIMEYIAWRKQR